MLYLIKVLILVFLSLIKCLYSDDNVCENYGDDCNPLLLTPLINEGRIKEARTKSEVRLEDFKPVKSYSGYLTVSEQFNSSLFFWFFPSENDYEEAPVVLWLQGGPGSTMFIGVFLEHGPFIVTQDYEIKIRKHRWTKNQSVIYIDSPTGTGFSFTNLDGFAKNQTIIAEHLYNALLQFFKVFPEIEKNPFFISGESYGGKYVPAIAYKISMENRKAKRKINLKGLTIGNGFSDPEHQIQYSELYFQNGLIDLKTKTEFENLEKEILARISQKEWEEAYKLFCKLIYYDKQDTLFKNVTGFEAVYNLLYPNSTYGYEMFEFVLKEEVMAALHASYNITFLGLKVNENLMLDIMQSVSPLVEKLLEQYPILIYHGQLDLIVSYAGTVNYLNHLNFTGSFEYKNSVRQKWFVNDTLAGYIKVGGNLTEVLVRNSGHMVANNQPAWALELITKFTRNQSLY